MKHSILLPLGLGICFCLDAHAYVDPGSGFILWQLIVAILAGILFHARRLFSFRKETKKRRTPKNHNS